MTAAVTNVFTGDTIQPQVTFRDWAPVGTSGPVVDPTSVAFNVYDSNTTLILAVASGDATIIKEAPGIYHRDWTVPNTEGTYFIEFVGTLTSEPTVIRSKIVAKFKPQ